MYVYCCLIARRKWNITHISHPHIQAQGSVQTVTAYIYRYFLISQANCVFKLTSRAPNYFHNRQTKRTNNYQALKSRSELKIVTAINIPSCNVLWFHGRILNVLFFSAWSGFFGVCACALKRLATFCAKQRQQQNIEEEKTETSLHIYISHVRT